MTQTYKDYYENFLTSYQSGMTNAEQIGKAVCDMAQYFCDANITYVQSEIIFNKVAAAIEQSTDENGKALSSAKAKTISESRDEYGDMVKNKMIIENIEQILKALKSLQVGVLKEFSYVSNS